MLDEMLVRAPRLFCAHRATGARALSHSVAGRTRSADAHAGTVANATMPRHRPATRLSSKARGPLAFRYSARGEGAPSSSISLVPIHLHGLSNGSGALSAEGQLGASRLGGCSR